jgi:hypothetical protein
MNIAERLPNVAAGADDQTAPYRLLCYERELFEFVRQAGVEAMNNRAELAVRPLAVARKISGGRAARPGARRG